MYQTPTVLTNSKYKLTKFSVQTHQCNSQVCSSPVQCCSPKESCAQSVPTSVISNVTHL